MATHLSPPRIHYSPSGASDPYPRPSVDARFARVNATGGCSSALHGPAATLLSSSAAWRFATGTPECCPPSAAVCEDRHAAGGQDEPGCCCTCALCGPEAACYGCWSSPRQTLRCQAYEEGAGSELRSYNTTPWAGLPFVGGVPPTPAPWETRERTCEEGSSGAEHAAWLASSFCGWASRCIWRPGDPEANPARPAPVIPATPHPGGSACFSGCAVSEGARLDLGAGATGEWTVQGCCGCYPGLSATQAAAQPCAQTAGWGTPSPWCMAPHWCAESRAALAARGRACRVGERAAEAFPPWCGLFHAGRAHMADGRARPLPWYRRVAPGYLLRLRVTCFL